MCSAVHPLAISSPAFRDMPLRKYGLTWIQPDAPLAHPLDGGRAVMMERSIRTTAGQFGRDAEAYRNLLEPIALNWDRAICTMMGQPRLPKDPLGLLRTSFATLFSTSNLLKKNFSSSLARALLSGLAGHSNLRMEDSPSAGFAMILAASGHAVGWPFPQGGAGKLSQALSAYLRSLGVRIETGHRVDSLDELPKSRVILCDLSPRELVRISGTRLPEDYLKKLTRFAYGPGAFKLDWALDAAIPWSAPQCIRAGTVHLGGSAEEIAASEREVWAGGHPERPFVIAAQHTLFDPSRAPAGKHTAWAYCHVPNGSTVDMTDRIEQQIERFAPGFRSRIIARSVHDPLALESHNSNLVGGDIYGGANRLLQLLARPTLTAYCTPDPSVLLCSASTPPGAGVHGMCGYFAAHAALLRLRTPALWKGWNLYGAASHIPQHIMVSERSSTRTMRLLLCSTIAISLLGMFAFRSRPRSRSDLRRGLSRGRGPARIAFGIIFVTSLLAFAIKYRD